MESVFFSNAETLISNLQTLPFASAAILLKGARVFRFEQIMKRMEKKLHETVLEINLNAVAHNLKFYRSLLPAGTRMMVMVKAFSYGSGMLEIANLLQFNRVDYLAVAFADEGVELRRNGISLPVMVMNSDIYSFDSIIDYNLEPEIYSIRILDAFTSLVVKNGLTSFPVHIKIDTGMHRLGFTKDEISILMDRLRGNKALRVASVFSHLAASDDASEDEFTMEQINSFKAVCDEMQKELGYDFIRHIANTSAIERLPDSAMDMVRLGIGLYGYSAGHSDKLEPAGCMKTSVSQIRRLKKGDTVGYNRRGKMNRDSVIATIPLGYADGLFRSLGNGKVKFRINRQEVPTIGNICMDMCMLDVTDLSANEGDIVTIFESSQDVVDIATAAGTIPYEFLVHISQRVKRIYLQE
jgi:alanine racemase